MSLSSCHIISISVVGKYCPRGHTTVSFESLAVNTSINGNHASRRATAHRCLPSNRISKTCQKSQLSCCDHSKNRERSGVVDFHATNRFGQFFPIRPEVSRNHVRMFFRTVGISRSSTKYGLSSVFVDRSVHCMLFDDFGMLFVRIAWLVVNAEVLVVDVFIGVSGGCGCSCSPRCFVME